MFHSIFNKLTYRIISIRYNIEGEGLLIHVYKSDISWPDVVAFLDLLEENVSVIHILLLVDSAAVMEIVRRKGRGIHWFDIFYYSPSTNSKQTFPIFYSHWLNCRQHEDERQEKVTTEWVSSWVRCVRRSHEVKKSVEDQNTLKNASRKMGEFKLNNSAVRHIKLKLNASTCWLGWVLPYFLFERGSQNLCKCQDKIFTLSNNTDCMWKCESDENSSDMVTRKEVSQDGSSKK